MKKLFMKFCVVVLSCFMVFNTAYLPSYAEDEMSYYEQNDLANSFRYSNGQTKASGRANYVARASVNSGWPEDSRAISKGIDVSYHNGTIDWKKVKQSEVEYAIIRCGYGTDDKSQDDKKWEENVKGCTDNNIPYGVYLYSYADTVAKAKSEAAHVLRLVRGHKITYPIYYDLEDNYILSHTNAKQRQKIIQAFTNSIKKAGYSVGVFAPKSWFEKELPEASFNQCEKWVAHWSTKCTYQGSYQMWQATNRGTVNGINGAVDINFLMLPAAKITVKAAKKKVKVFWNQKGNGIKVQVFCSTKKNKGYKKAATINSSKGKATIKKLKSKKKYYFKVRCLKIVKGHTYYSAYSKIKTIKIK